ncbi:hypothetical protein AbraIFM66951_005985 [Aspergillus brasiliensis]|uniref:BZIP domain-containing protein n=1 Tax=Aspergillus brasiliensis TaxID=319629 RepID=A0A9W5Z305_9EURO|nr:hypothetical protein AbraCBS73388_005009 [Aspergillus brasiliensis]GKZ51529.1 hypothetical protein AbraIFM66951_005985 [Aspergillus brasiliensis]
MSCHGQRDSERSQHRRLQLRLAQRAYRSRKERATLSLQHRLEHLQTQIQNLCRTFQEYNHLIETSGLLFFDPTLERKLQELRTQFLAISAAADSSNEGSSALRLNDIASPMTQPRKQRMHSQQLEYDLELATSRPVNAGLDVAGPIPSFSGAGGQENDPRGKTADQSYSFLPTPTLHVVNRLESAPRAVDDSAFLNVMCHSHISSSTAPLRETSFERRLHRACLKNGYKLLVDPTSDPDNVSRVFRLPLTLSTRDSIVQQVKGLLEGGLDEAPELWDMPFFLLGGAGTHYPRRDQTGRPILPPNALPMSKLIGAFIHQRTEQQSFQTDHDLLADLGLNGEWLDSHDVEGYLKEKGIFLSADTSFCSVPTHVSSMETRPSDKTSANAQQVMDMHESGLGYMPSHNKDLMGPRSRGSRPNMQVLFRFTTIHQRMDD